MKLLMVICPEERRDQVTAMVEKHGVRSFTELPQVLGEGVTGKRLGTHVWPGQSVLMASVFVSSLRSECATFRRMARHGNLPQCVD